MMSKFKVGDRVRCVEDYPHQFTKGKEYIVRYYDADDNRLGVVSDDEGDENGIGARYFEPVLTIQAGRYYKTRDGRKVGPMVPGSGGGSREYAWTAPQQVGDFVTSWTTEGLYHVSDRRPEIAACDLIAEWVDDPVAVAPATATFKAGDRVNYRDSNVAGVGFVHSAARDEGCWYVTVEDKDRGWAYFINDTARSFEERDLSLATTIKVGDWVRTDAGDIGIVLHDDGSDCLQFKVGYVGDYDETWDWFSDLKLTIVPPGTTKASNDNSALLAEIDELERCLSDLRARAA